MTGFGGWLLRRRISRIALIAGLFPLGMLGVVSAAVVVFVAELQGWRKALEDSLVALAILVIVTLVFQGEWEAVVISAGSTWTSALGLGALTGLYGSMTLALQAILMLAVLGVVLFTVWVNDPVAYWEGFITDFAEQMTELGVQIAEPALLMPLAPLLTGAIAASAVISSVLALLLGSWWASKAGGPDLRAMFIEIRLGNVIGVLMMLAGGVTIFSSMPLAVNLLLVLGIGFSFQGLSVIYWQATKRGWPGTALLLIYLPLLLGPSIAVLGLFLLAAVGFTDNWFRLRRAGGDLT